MKTCKNCQKQFEITTRDKEFFAKIEVPHPTLCDWCRRQRRFAFRNERFLYKRTSALSGEEIISAFHPDEKIPVYKTEEWWSDSWDSAKYERDFDFARPFFEQFAKLQRSVPAMAYDTMNNENCPFVNYAASCKNCHMIYGSIYCEDCLYGNPYYCTSCVDSLLVRDSQWCYDCITCEKCHTCFFCQDCVDSHDLILCYDCHSCKNCIGSTSLRHKEYYIFNKPYSKEDFKKMHNSMNLCDPQQFAQIKEKFLAQKLKYPHRCATLINTQNCTGDYIYQSKNSFDCYDVQRLEDCGYCAQVIDMKDCYDCNYMEECELCYDFISNYRNQRVFFSIRTNNCVNAWYSNYCVGSQDIFGCIGLKHKKYCILNKQYTREEYEKLILEIVEYMKKNGEYGEFFPPKYSLFCYNETVANEYFPLSREEALAQGYRWREENPKEYKKQTYEIPQNIADTPNTLINEILACTTCGKNFKIVKAEFEFYKKFGLPIPKKCPDHRHADRLARRTPRRLSERTCAKCAAVIKTTYTKDRREPIYCEKCYLEKTY